VLDCQYITLTLVRERRHAEWTRVVVLALVEELGAGREAILRNVTDDH
jgi:hypothetical protein